MNREVGVWFKIVMNCFITGFHFTKVTPDRICLVYAVMTDLSIDIGAMLKSTIRKEGVH